MSHLSEFKSIVGHFHMQLHDAFYPKSRVPSDDKAAMMLRVTVVLPTLDDVPAITRTGGKEEVMSLYIFSLV